MLPTYYEFQNSTKILSGKNALENISYELSGLGASRPIVLSDNVLKKIGSLQKVLDAMSLLEWSRLPYSRIFRRILPFRW